MLEELRLQAKVFDNQSINRSRNSCSNDVVVLHDRSLRGTCTESYNASSKELFPDPSNSVYIKE